MSFARLSITIGSLLIFVTVFLLFTSNATYFTAFLPAIAGIIMAALGYLANMSEGGSARLMHLSTLVAALTLLGSLRVFTVLNDPNEAQASVMAQFAALVISGIFVVMSIRSFLAARR
jgi:hypothetical protein